MEPRLGKFTQTAKYGPKGSLMSQTHPDEQSSGNNSLSLAEAVPLVTVLLQRLLEVGGVRALAIKGPGFAQLGVRTPRLSNDVDLLIHPEDRSAAAEKLVAAGWRPVVQADLPAVLDEVFYSTTFWHPMLPTSVDVHHHFPGLLCDDDATFEALWRERSSVTLAHQEVPAPSAAAALVMETVNLLRSLPEPAWDSAAATLAPRAPEIPVEELVATARQIGASCTAASLIRARGGQDECLPGPAFERWRTECGPDSFRRFVGRVVRRHPRSVPRVVARHLVPSRSSAEHWAAVRGLSYEGRWQVARHRASALLRRREA